MTTTTTCPDWCKRDHEAAAHSARELNASIADRLTPAEAANDLDEALEYQRDYHSTGDLSDVLYCRIVTEPGDDRPRISVEVPNDDDLSAQQARNAAAALIAAADLLEQIEAA